MRNKFMSHISNAINARKAHKRLIKSFKSFPIEKQISLGLETFISNVHDAFIKVTTEVNKHGK